MSKHVHSFFLHLEHNRRKIKTINDKAKDVVKAGGHDVRKT